MATRPESPKEWEENPEVFVPEHLMQYMFSTFDRAFAADESAHGDSFDIGNGRFTHQEALATNSGTFPNAWRVDMAPPHGRKKGYKAQVFLALDPQIDVIEGEPFDTSSGTLFIREYVKSKWRPLVLVDVYGATSAEVIEVIDIDKVLAPNRNNPVKRAEAIYAQLRGCNMSASVD